jgi:hypothetical protein
LDLNNIFGEVEVDGSCGFFSPTILLVPFRHGGLILGHQLLQALGEHKGNYLSG